ncbi:MAG: FtsX-like permease family protein [Verrucomicrobiales bacterium]|nr:FtsX-like permease family protein [Verrucomicrobiales bacterium]
MEGNATLNERPVAIGRLLWSRIIWRHWRREPRLILVLVGILALGVAVFLSVRLANKAAVSGFGMFTESIAGESDFILRPTAGTLDVSALRQLRERAGSTPVGIFPVLEVSAVSADRPEDGWVKMVGADLVALQNAAIYTGGGALVAGDSAAGDDGIPGLADRGFVGSSFARRFGIVKGEAMPLIVNGVPVEFDISGVIPENPNLPSVPDNLILMDLPGLQSLAELEGKLSRIELRIAPGIEAGENRQKIGALMWDLAAEKGWILETPEDRKSSVTQMSAAFRLNLTILSGLALLVGIYLIMQAMEAAVVKRRGEIAVLRSLGVTPAQIRAAWLWEGFILGLAGAIVGIILGRLMAMGLVVAISRTVNTLYYETTTSAVTLERGEILFSLVFGVTASLVAALIPAREASMTLPAQSMREGGQGGGLALLRQWPLGLILLAVGIGFAFVPPRVLASGSIVPLGGYLAAVVLVLSASLLIGLLFKPLSMILKRGGKDDPMRLYAASQLRRPEGRHRLTAAGLAVAIGMSAAMGILVASFETTLTGWIQQLLKADLYVAAAGTNSVTNGNTLSASTWEMIEDIPGVSGTDKIRRYEVSVQENNFFLGGVDYNDDPDRFLQLMWLEPPALKGPASLETRSGEAFPGWASESLARRFSLEVGSRIPLPTAEGERPIEVAGIFAEYGNETGTLLVARKFTREWFGDDRISNLAVYLDPEADVELVLETIRKTFPGLVARTNRKLRTDSIRIFHQTFAVTYALEAIAVFIAVAGLGLALAGLLLERRDELATLKALGATRREIARSAMWEGIGLALAGLTGGYLLSFLLGWILIFVINPQSFGWTLSYHVPWFSYIALAAITLSTAAGVAWSVGYRNANLRGERKE